MILANFDLSFFTSIPGMLITGGVLLLLIALIIFIATGSKKDKKDKKAEAESIDNTNNTVAETPTVNANVATEPVAPVTTPPLDTTTVADAPQIVVTTPEVPSEPVNVVENNAPTVNEPNSQNLNQTVEANTIPNEVVNPQVEMPTQTVEPVTTNVNDNTSVNTNPVVMPSEQSNIEQASVPNNTVDLNNQESNEVVDAPPITIVNEEPKENPVIEPAKPIYGGTDPVIPKIEVEGNEHRPIYGGANPLENTGAIPTINTTAEKINPTVTPEVPNIEQPVETPKVEPEVINIPTVDNAPVEPITPVQDEKREEQVVVEEPKQEPKKEVEVESLF